MINVSFRPRLGVTFKKVRKGVNEEHQLFSSELLEQVRAATPIKDGRARRGWSERKMGDKIRVTNRIPYQKAIAGDLEKITVKEWDMEIYCKRTYAFRDESKVIELQQQGKTVEALVESLIVKALDKDGQKIFVDADRVNLMNEADPAVIIKVAGLINNIGLRKPIGDLVKE